LKKEAPSPLEGEGRDGGSIEMNLTARNLRKTVIFVGLPKNRNLAADIFGIIKLKSLGRTILQNGFYLQSPFYEPLRQLIKL